jgi:hypothetical protein
MRPKHPHAAESGVGEYTARESEAPNSVHWKERAANAHRNLAPEPQGSGAFYFPPGRQLAVAGGAGCGPPVAQPAHGLSAA